MSEPGSNVTRLLARIREGDSAALDELLPLVSSELRRLAQSYMRRQRPGHTLQPTALVNEAFIKIIGRGQPDVADRAHFLALMSRVMRQVLVDHARGAAAAKRGGGEARVEWDTQIELRHERGGAERLQVLRLHDAIDALSREHPSLAQVVEMHYFGGMTAEETALAVGRSVHVVRHDLRLARAWLRRELS